MFQDSQRWQLWHFPEQQLLEAPPCGEQRAAGPTTVAGRLLVITGGQEIRRKKTIGFLLNS
jgi:hypothetical protein